MSADGTIPAYMNRASLHEVHMAVAECIYGLGLPFDVVSQPLFQKMCSKINNYKGQYKPLSSYQARTTYLRDVKKDVDKRLEVRMSSVCTSSLL